MIRLCLIAFLLHSATLVAETRVELAELGSFELQFSPVTESPTYLAKPVWGIVKARPTDSFVLRAPINPQQRLYLVGDGQTVQQGQVVAKLVGSEIHHFKERLASQQVIVAQAKQRYETNQALVAQQAISQERWQSIMAYYFEQDLLLGHLKHFAELLEFTDKPDEAYLLSPLAGIFRHTELLDNDEAELGQVIPHSTLRINTQLSLHIAQDIVALQHESCRFPVDSWRVTVSGLSVSLWTQPVAETCDLKSGAGKVLHPVINKPTYAVPAASVFQFEGRTTVAKLISNAVLLVPVEIVGATAQDKVLIAPVAVLRGADVLSTSVSALQGVLLGLGEE